MICMLDRDMVAALEFEEDMGMDAEDEKDMFTMSVR